MKLLRLLPAAAIALAALPAFAHTGGAHGAGLVAGFAHPVGGLDHLLAMVTVGLWAVQAGGRAVWLMPLAFLAAMVAGGALGMAGIGLPAVELAILASVVLLGTVVALKLKPALPLGMAVVAALAIFHGHAHGAEMPAAAAPVLYGAGFLVATGLLHAAGVFGSLGIARLVREKGELLVRGTGAAIAASGAVLMVV
ncbi:HupE/UreJ family protein [Magnetospirillum sp. UT-4]|uniref:HupE/UreJ family protein n=1 Tax=Magnetospirillum sp. UT-4 TaxID=2681467 RepID=UPI0013843A94|nr:HupE/UreJ family protein [Magnetospirillum sp. UT-4]CAA7618878.1 Protein HupE [Magnetospirillum sp. UT-4]